MANPLYWQDYKMDEQKNLMSSPPLKIWKNIDDLFLNTLFNEAQTGVVQWLQKA